MKIKFLVVKIIALILLALAPSSARAQVPPLSPIPEGLSNQQREELTARRSRLEAKGTALRAKAKPHNEKCANVPANTPLANECRQAQALLQGEIAAYIEAVKAFNQMIDQLSAMPQTGALSLLSERDELDLGRKMAKEAEGRMTFVTDPQITTTYKDSWTG